MSQKALERNVVVLGETGTGKSSLFNNLAMVLNYRSLDDVERVLSNFTPPIPVRTTFKNVRICQGRDTNERSDIATSRTKKPQIYRIKSECGVFNFIDTPGIQDSDGQAVDTQHVQNITSVIYQMKEIHAILILLKSSENTLNPSLKYTLNMVLSCLGKTAAKLIRFGITRVGHNKNPGAATEVISKYLQELSHNPGVSFETENAFYFENEPLFQVLAAKQGVNMNDVERLVCEKAYENNIEEFGKLFNLIWNCKAPYNALNVQLLMTANQMQPALNNFLPSLDEIQKRFEKLLSTLENEILRGQCAREKVARDLKSIREVTEVVQVPKKRKVRRKKKVKLPRQRSCNPPLPRIPPIPLLWPLGPILDVISGPPIPRPEDIEVEVSYSEEETYFETERRNRFEVVENSAVKSALVKMDSEIHRLEEQNKETLDDYKAFQTDKQMLMDMTDSLNGYLEEHAMVALNVAANAVSKRGQSNNNVSPEVILSKLDKIQKSHHFGQQIEKFLLEFKSLENVKFTVVDFNVTPGNYFFQKIFESK